MHMVVGDDAADTPNPHSVASCLLCLPVCLQYEQRNMMFPHRKYVRRDGASS